MDVEHIQTNVAAKLPLLKQNEFEMWRLRVEQYFQVQDYALWEIIEEGNSFKPGTTTSTVDDALVTTVQVNPITAEERIQKRNDLKARSMLLMSIPNDQLLVFNKYKCAKTLFQAIVARFGGNDATKKTQKTLLKQQFENFSATPNDSLDSMFNRLQKLSSQLAIHEVIISQEDLNSKFLRSLPSEWAMHVIVWKNKPDIDSMSLNDLYSNFKIVEHELKKSTSSSSGNMAFMSSHGTTKKVDEEKDGREEGTANTNFGTASTSSSTKTILDETIGCAFLTSQHNGSTLTFEDLQEISDDDLEEMDIKWQLSLLSMRAKKYLMRTGKKIVINSNEPAGYDKSKVECYNCHMKGHYSRECRRPKKQGDKGRGFENKNKGNNENKSKEVDITETRAMVAIDGLGFDWSFMGEEESSSNEIALMALSNPEVQITKCSATCEVFKELEILRKLYDELKEEQRKTHQDLVNHKCGMSKLEKQIIHFRENELTFSDTKAILNRDIFLKDAEINLLRTEFAKVKQAKDNIQLTVTTLENASACTKSIVENQMNKKIKSGIGYNTCPPPYRGIPCPPGLDLAESGFHEHTNKSLEKVKPVENSEPFESTSNTSLSKEKVLTDKSSDVTTIESCTSDENRKETVSKKGNKVGLISPKSVESITKTKVVLKTVECCAKCNSKPRGSQRNWNNLKSHQLGDNFVLYNKACYYCGSFNHTHAYCNNWVSGSTSRSKTSKTNPRKGSVKSNTPKVNHTVRTNEPVYPKFTTKGASNAFKHTPKVVKSHIERNFVDKTQDWKPKPKVSARPYGPARPNGTAKFGTVRPKTTKCVKNKNAVKSSACWIWRPLQPNGASTVLKRFDYIDARGKPKSVMAWVPQRN